ncbi:hypothetical protein WH47_06909, partial [Habropoda laboriosa]
EIGVLVMVLRNPQISFQQIDGESAISRGSVLQILPRYIFHLYHISLRQDFDSTNFMNRVAFCQWAKKDINIGILTLKRRLSENNV